MWLVIVCRFVLHLSFLSSHFLPIYLFIYNVFSSPTFSSACIVCHWLRPKIILVFFTLAICLHAPLLFSFRQNPSFSPLPHSVVGWLQHTTHNNNIQITNNSHRTRILICTVEWYMIIITVYTLFSLRYINGFMCYFAYFLGFGFLLVFAVGCATYVWTIQLPCVCTNVYAEMKIIWLYNECIWRGASSIRSFSTVPPHPSSPFS